MRIIIGIINFIALTVAIVWWYTNPGLEPVVTTITLFAGLVAQVFLKDEIKSKIKLIQKSNKRSNSYQSARDQTINDNKTVQKGGDGSQQFRADHMVVSVGIDEKRAREIYQEMNTRVREDYSQEAFDIARSRIEEFENRLMPKMEEVDGALEIFSDPGFQLLLVEAQKSAASSERPEDYDLLSELLLHRFQKGENRIARAGISRAVEVVDKISDDALIGLTVSHAVATFLPQSGDVREGLNVLNNLFGKLFYGDLPIGNDWIDHLDILDTVRINTFGRLKNAQEYYSEALSGYTDVGIEKGSQEYDEALEILRNTSVPQDILVEHVFNDNYVRIRGANKGALGSVQISRLSPSDGSLLTRPLSEEQVSALVSVYDLYKQDNKLKVENVNLFMKEWDEMVHLKALKDWWDNIETSFQVTSVGKVLAHSNAQRCDKSLPPLN